MVNLNQLKAAQTAMLDWLSDPKALGKAPARLEYGGVFAMDDMNYYMFRFKKENAPLAKWMLAVCGGFKGEDMECSGRIMSSMSEYTANAQADAIKLLSAS